MAINKIKTILYTSDLIGYDGKEAFRVAIGQAIANHAKLIFLNVIEPLSPSAERAVSLCLTKKEFDDIRTDGFNLVEADITARIKEFVDEERDSGVEVSLLSEILVEKGKPSETILKAAEDKNVDMIVMGTRTHNKLSQILLGSTAHQVLFHSKCPVLVVPIG